MNRSALTCYDRSDLYRAQWAIAEPDYAHDELFIVGPFSLSVAANGTLSLNLPTQLDDDVPFYLRAVYFGELDPGNGFPGNGVLARLRDCFGNMLGGELGTGAAGLIYALGAWGSALDGVNAFGFTVEPEVECSPGGTLLWDFQVSSQGTAASFSKTGVSGSIEFVSAIMGAAGNGATIELLHTVAPNLPLSVAVVGRAVTVTLATNGASAISSTFAQVAAIINNTPAVQAVMFALLFTSNPAEVITALVTTPLAGGSNGGQTNLVATLIGVKRFVRCAS
jgi:hypothetical protein